MLELEHDAATDALTGVGNRRALNAALERAVDGGEVGEINRLNSAETHVPVFGPALI